MKINVQPKTLRFLVRATVVCALLGVSATITLAAPPAGFYDTADPTNATTLRASLHEIIDDHVFVRYTSTSLDTWDVLEAADEDPNNASNILDVYKNAVYAKVGGGTGDYNREHSWPKSYGFPEDTSTQINAAANSQSNYPYTDCHHLFLCDISYNSSRNNLPYDFCSAACTENPTDLNNGAGGGTGSYPGNSNWRTGSGNTGTWETWIGRRGDVARALLYMDVRYDGSPHSLHGAAEPDLILTDNDSLIVSNTSSNQSVAYMGILSTLLDWHLEDPVDDLERARHEEVYIVQDNRNPFIDHPEWVDCVFNNVCTSNCSVPADCDDGAFCNGAEDCISGFCQSGGDPCPGQSCDETTDTCFTPEGQPWINEFHYDNISTDTGEFVEIAGPDGTNLTGWQVVGYNGSTGDPYGSPVSLSGTLTDQGGCIGVADFDFAGMQNGAPDGLALVDDQGAVVEFISYEGSFTALSGPANGLLSTDVGVVESNSTTPAGDSLQLSGSGAEPVDFTWQAPAAETRGLPNTGQTFDACAGCLIDADCDDGLYCNGAETCDGQGVCQPGTAVDCDDAVACTDDTCNETTDSCDNATNDSNCDNGLFCDGAETCNALLDCLGGSDPCPGQDCDEINETCVTAGCDNDGVCESGEDCNNCPADCFAGGGGTCGNGICEAADGEDCEICPEDCNGRLGGKPSNRFCCGDGTAQYGVTCADPACTDTGFDCTDVPAPGTCCGDDLCEGSEDESNCAIDCACFDDADCEDGDLCTINTCSGGTCFTDPVDCDDGDACTTDACDPGTGSCNNDPVSCDDGDACSADSCDPVLGCENTFPVCGLSDGCCGPACDAGNDPDCFVCGSSGDACTVNADCCSNKCKGNGTCR